MFTHAENISSMFSLNYEVYLSSTFVRGGGRENYSATDGNSFYIRNIAFAYIYELAVDDEVKTAVTQISKYKQAVHAGRTFSTSEGSLIDVLKKREKELIRQVPDSGKISVMKTVIDKVSIDFEEYCLKQSFPDIIVGPFSGNMPTYGRYLNLNLWGEAGGSNANLLGRLLMEKRRELLDKDRYRNANFYSEQRF